MTATSHDNGEPVTSVVAKPDFLMRSSEDLNLYIGKFDFGHFVHWRIDDEELGRDRPLVFGARKKDAVARDAKFGGELVAEAIRFPVREGDFGDGEPTSVVKVDGGGHLFDAEVCDTGFDAPPNALVFGCIPLQADGLCDGVGHGNDLCLQRLAPSNSEATPPMMSVSTLSTPAFEVVRM